MVSRVDYVIALLCVGFLIGALLGRPISAINSSRLARTYYIVIALLTVFRGAAFLASSTIGGLTILNTINAGIGDAGTFLLGAVFGIAVCRSDRREFLCDPFIISALCLSLSVAFVMAGMGKSLHMPGMVAFFTRSGYTTSFLRFILVAEALGGIGLLIPWATLPAVVGLSIDMIGVIYTHAHNGDSINDDTGPVTLLIRILAIAGLWAWKPQLGESNASLRRRFAAILIGAVFCGCVAIAGGMQLRQPSLRQAVPKANTLMIMPPSRRGSGHMNPVAD